MWGFFNKYLFFIKGCQLDLAQKVYLACALSIN